MSSFVQFVVVYLTVAFGMVLSQNVQQPPRFVQPPRGGGATFTCPNQDRGSYEYPGDCAQFYQCDGGVSTLIVCPAQLYFNPRQGYCDYASNLQNPNCSPRQSSLSTQLRDICRDNPGIADQAFIVGHPDLCNAFYTCSPQYLHNPCTFCGEYEYFSQEARGCRNYQVLGQDINTICQGRRYVDHGQKVVEQLLSCWPYDIPNPFLAILAGRSNTTPTPQRNG